MTLDHLILLMVGIGACIGLFRGFFREIVATVGLLLAVIAANFVSPYARPYLDWFKSETVSAVIVWMVSFFLVMFLLSRLASLLDRLMQSVELGCLNRFAGGLFGAMQYCLLAALFLSLVEVICAHATDLTQLQQWLHDSRIAPYLHRMIDLISPWASQHILAPALELLK